MNWSIQGVFTVLILNFYQIFGSFERERETIYDFYPGRISLLKSGEEQKSTEVADKLDCVFACTSIYWCRSINFRKTSQPSGAYICELLSFDYFINKKSIKPDENYDHYSIRNPCQNEPCKHGGECVYDGDLDKHHCICNNGYKGDSCENGPRGLEKSAILSYRDNNTYTTALSSLLDPAVKYLGPGTWKRCWRAMEDGWQTESNFHSQCDGKKHSVTIIRVRLSIFGGFSDKSWHTVGAYTASNKAFLFSLHNTISGFQPLQFNLTGSCNQYAIYGNKGYGPTFGNSHDIHISNLASSSTSSFTHSKCYQTPPGCTHNSACKFLAGTSNFRPTDIEVFYYETEQSKGLHKSSILNGNQSYISVLNSFLATSVPNSNTSDWIRCWHAAEDGWDVRYTFHPQCDGKKPSVTLIRVGSYVFGGFTDKPWSSHVTSYVLSTKSFLFSLYNINGYQPIQFNLTGSYNTLAIYNKKAYGPSFGGGHDIHISNLASSNTGSYQTPHSYHVPNGCSFNSRCPFMAGSSPFKPSDIEVFYLDGDIRGLEKSSILTKHGNAMYVDTLNNYLNTVQRFNLSNWRRCWGTTDDGWHTSLSFHPQCDGKRNTVSLIRVGSYVFGGFTDVSWHSGGVYTLSNKAFIFSLFNINGFKPVQLNLTGQRNAYAIYGIHTYGPTFGDTHDIYIPQTASSNTQSYTTPSTYQVPPGCTFHSSSCSFFAGSHKFKPNEIEVFYYDGVGTAGLDQSAILAAFSNFSSITNDLVTLLEPVVDLSGSNKWLRCWHAREDGWDTRLTFHPQCDGIKNTVTIVRVGLYVFGAFADKAWNSANSHHTSTKAFIFSLYNKDGLKPLQFNLTGGYDNYAILGRADYGPTFGHGHDLHISNVASTNEASSTKPKSYSPPQGCSKDVSCSFFAGSTTFTVDDVEVYFYSRQTTGLDNSVILAQAGDNSYINTLNNYLATVVQNSKPSDWIRCWRAAEDGWDTRMTFHPQCDGKKNTVVIIRVGSYVFGGFTDKSWHTVGLYTHSSKSFIFSLYNKNGNKPVQLNLTNQYNQYAIYGNAGYGPTFGSSHDIHISSLASTNSNSFTKPYAYQPPDGCSHNANCIFFASTYRFQPSDVEVFYHDTVIKGFEKSVILSINASYAHTLNNYLATVVQNSKPSDWIRCWRSAEDGWDTRMTFHPQCDGKKNTVVIIRVGSYVFGGFTDKPWHTASMFTPSNKSFLYSLYNTNGYKPTRLNLINQYINEAIYGHSNNGPTFGNGNDIFISNLASGNTNSYTKPKTYQAPSGCSQNVGCSFLAGSNNFRPSDIEVFYWQPPTID